MKVFKDISLRNKLHSAAINAIWRSHSQAFSMHSSNRPDEPHHVASFVLNGMPILAKYWEESLTQHGIKLNLTSVFCHSYPRVTFEQEGSVKTVELADLLMVRRHFHQGVLQKETACLIQSKMSSDSTNKVEKDDAQFYLFKNWPTFRFQQKEYNNASRAIGNVSGQSLYSLIVKERYYPEMNFLWPDTCFWSIVYDLRMNMESDASFARFLEQLFAFETGREFFSNPSVGCEWSKVIQELLEVTFQKKLTAGPFRASKRGCSVDMFNLMNSDALDSDSFFAGNSSTSNEPPTIDNLREPEQNPQGISTIIIETNQLEPERRNR